MKREIIIYLGGLFILMLIKLVYSNQAPVIDFASSFENSSIMPGESRVYYILASDVDEDNLTYIWKVDNKIVNFSGNTYNYVGGQPGNFIITVEVSDGNFNVSKSWFVNVVKEDYKEFSPEERVYVKEWYWKLLVVVFVVAIIVCILILIIYIREKHFEKIQENK